MKNDYWSDEKFRAAASDLDRLRNEIRNSVQYFRSFGISKRYPKVHTSHIEERSNNTPDIHHKEQSDENQSEKKRQK